MIDHTLSDSLAASLEDQTSRAIEFTENNDYITAAAILGEWTLTDGTCVLTSYISESLDTIKEELLYAHLDEDGIGYGTFSFVGSVQLPNDNI